MANTHEAELVRDSSHKLTITDPSPLPSAVLFKHVSDELWARNDDSEDITSRVASVLSVGSALVVMNAAIRGIDSRFVLAGEGKGLRFRGPGGERARISPVTLAKPIAATLETVNWDDRWTARQVKVDGENCLARFTDGHHDYARELTAGFNFYSPQSKLVVSYTMQRYQHGQGEPTKLNATVWYDRFMGQGYEDQTLHERELTEAQEVYVLKAFATIGGIATRGFTP